MNYLLFNAKPFVASSYGAYLSTPWAISSYHFCPLLQKQVAPPNPPVNRVVSTKKARRVKMK
ncbi:hypothetical protein [Polaribacter sp. HL-MS24]|uniref:hypothetical protein n=1 Tax=Polaribacter sp. HL-MS24 TaxID=3077735 RepID=UPI002934FE7E|nr:hypothetical protein [Polaribacter sp. HL-MS24]WOC40889.1 hypothetical protein RRF69_03695 [Polaribacter sp. HL-MS24]